MALRLCREPPVRRCLATVVHEPAMPEDYNLREQLREVYRAGQQCPYRYGHTGGHLRTPWAIGV